MASREHPVRALDALRADPRADLLDTETMKRARGWSDEQWTAEQARLVERGLLEPDRSLAERGAGALDAAEAFTNRRAIGPWQHLDDDALREIAGLLVPIALACAPVYGQPNPIGMPEPWDPIDDPDATSVAEIISRHAISQPA